MHAGVMGDAESAGAGPILPDKFVDAVRIQGGFDLVHSPQREVSFHGKPAAA